MSKPEIKFSDAWCVCMAGVLEDGHGDWPIAFAAFHDPFHWCPNCYDDAIKAQRDDAEDDGELDDFDPDSEQVTSKAMDVARVIYPGDTCDRGHEPPKEEA